MKGELIIHLSVVIGISLIIYVLSDYDLLIFALSLFIVGLLSIFYLPIKWGYQDHIHNKKIKKENKYEIYIKCFNCKTSNYYALVKGTCLSEYMIDKICKHCGCKMDYDKLTQQNNDNVEVK
uniref:ORF58 n=1 Tax=Nitrosopumilaceae spindle-shaped virus TaxID=3065433 RepID=A0AAT9J7M4_9VIRU